MEWIALIVAVLVVAGIIQGALGKSPGKTPRQASRSAGGDPLGKQGRLTNNQILCLASASKSKPIYAETPSHMTSQMPGEAACFNLRTVESLVKRGFLVSDQKGGYLLTDDGAIGLKRGMGFQD